MTLHLCACMGPAPGETHCYCQKKRLGLPTLPSVRIPDAAQIFQAIFERKPMQDNIKWTAEDEVRLRELEQRRKLFNDVQLPKLVDALRRAFRGKAHADLSTLAFILSQNADEVRDALKPFDSGVRPAQPSGGGQ